MSPDGVFWRTLAVSGLVREIDGGFSVVEIAALHMHNDLVRVEGRQYAPLFCPYLMRDQPKAICAIGQEWPPR